MRCNPIHILLLGAFGFIMMIGLLATYDTLKEERVKKSEHLRDYQILLHNDTVVIYDNERGSRTFHYRLFK